MQKNRMSFADSQLTQVGTASAGYEQNVACNPPTRYCTMAATLFLLNAHPQATAFIHNGQNPARAGPPSPLKWQTLQQGHVHNLKAKLWLGPAQRQVQPKQQSFNKMASRVAFYPTTARQHTMPMAVRAASGHSTVPRCLDNCCSPLTPLQAAHCATAALWCPCSNGTCPCSKGTCFASGCLPI
jgi:hypothetical protein